MGNAVSEIFRISRPLVMGIVNVTPDSFSDGGQSADLHSAVEKSLRLIADGADIIDIGGESTRPGALEVPFAEEIRRTAPVVRRLRELRPEVVISIDTRKSEVAVAAMEAGANLINDITGGGFSPAMIETAAAAGAGLIIGHSRGTPENMQSTEYCCYEDVAAAVMEFWRRTAAKAVAGGIPAENLIFDPGLGFAKTAEQNWELLRRLDELRSVGPVLVGHSRKTFLGKLLDRPDPRERDAATLAVSLYAAAHGADILRVHDVRSTVDALKTLDYLNPDLREN